VSEINLISHPSQSLKGSSYVPGDKSISHRSIIFGSIARGITEVEGFLQGEDCLATLEAFRSMGVFIEGPNHGRVVIHGVGAWGLKKPNKIIDCGNSGTSIRLLAGLLSAQRFDSDLTGDSSLLKRPMLRVSNPLTQMGALVTTHEGKAPLHITGGVSLKGIDYVMPEASAQVKSAILLAALYAHGTTTIKETGVSRDHTERMLKAFSYPIDRTDCSLIVRGGGECLATSIMVPGDSSSAAFFIVAATIIPGSDIVLTQVGINPTRIGILEILAAMGANITLDNKRFYGDEPVADICIKHAPLKGIAIPPELVPLAIDEFPIIFIAAACALGETTVHGAQELRFKESDRIGAMVDGLCQLGIDACAFDDGASIKGGTLLGGEVDSLGDHRIAMAFAIAGAVAQGPIKIKECSNVATSFPGFVETANKLHMHVEEEIDNTP
jgi:3-phosphoshikimate 1-carboxyvinyltransferase